MKTSYDRSEEVETGSAKTTKTSYDRLEAVEAGSAHKNEDVFKTGKSWLKTVLNYGLEVLFGIENKVY